MSCVLFFSYIMPINNDFLKALTNKKLFPIYHKGFIRYTKNTLWHFLEKLVRMLIGISVGIWVIRYLGPKDFGSLSYVESFVSLFASIAFLGLDDILFRELVNSDNKRNELLGTSLILKLIGAFFASILIAIVTYFIDNDHNINVLIFILTSSFFIRIFSVVEFYFLGRVLSFYIVFSNLAALILCAFLKIFFVLNNYPLIYFALIILLDVIITCFFYYFFYIKKEGSPFLWKFDAKLARKMLAASWPYILTGIIIEIYMKIDQVMLKEMIDSTAVGLYAAAAKISTSCHFIVPLILSSFFPAILNAKKRSEKEYLFRLKKLYELILLFYIIISSPIIIFSKEIIHLLYGSEFSISAQVLSIHMLCGLFVATGMIRSKWMLAENLQRYDLLIQITGILLNITFNFIFIKLYGVLGAAYGVLLSYLLTLLFTAVIIKPSRPSFIMMIKSILSIITLGFMKKGYFDFFPKNN